MNSWTKFQNSEIKLDRYCYGVYIKILCTFLCTNYLRFCLVLVNEAFWNSLRATLFLMRGVSCLATPSHRGMDAFI